MLLTVVIVGFTLAGQKVLHAKKCSPKELRRSATDRNHIGGLLRRYGLLWVILPRRPSEEFSAGERNHSHRRIHASWIYSAEIVVIAGWVEPIGCCCARLAKVTNPRTGCGDHTCLNRPSLSRADMHRRADPGIPGRLGSGGSLLIWLCCRTLVVEQRSPMTGCDKSRVFGIALR